MCLFFPLLCALSVPTAPSRVLGMQCLEKALDVVAILASALEQGP